MATLELRRLTKQFGPDRVVQGVDLQVHDGELLVVVGPSGCGKTTVLRMVAGLEPISSGDVLVGGVSVVGVSPWDGRDIVVGIRAQAVRFTNGAGLDIDVHDVDQSSSRCAIGATVRADAVVVVNGGVRVEHRAAPFVLDLDGDDELDLELWRRSTLTVDPEDIHLFDPTTGRSLLAASQRTRAAT